jgi:esterase/lipase
MSNAERGPEWWNERIDYDVNGGCHLWNKYQSHDGYGSFHATLAGVEVTILAHRANFMDYHRRPIAAGKQLDHLCRVRCCVNPRHLEEVSPLENVRRGDVYLGSGMCRAGLHPMVAGNLTYNRGGGRQCIACTKAKAKAYREANREEIEARMKAYREANHEEITAQAKAYREANHEEIKAQKKAYREANPEEIKARMKAYREANREELIARVKAYREANPEEIKARMKAYREANHEEIKAQKKAYREANREELIARDKAYREANHEEIKARKKARRARAK